MLTCVFRRNDFSEKIWSNLYYGFRYTFIDKGYIIFTLLAKRKRTSIFSGLKQYVFLACLRCLLLDIIIKLPHHITIKSLLNIGIESLSIIIDLHRYLLYRILLL